MGEEQGLESLGLSKSHRRHLRCACKQTGLPAGKWEE